MNAVNKHENIARGTATLASALSKEAKRALAKFEDLGSQIGRVVRPDSPEEERWAPELYDGIQLTPRSVASSTDTHLNWREMSQTPALLEGSRRGPSATIDIRLASDNRKRKFRMTEDDKIAYRISEDFHTDLSDWLSEMN